MKSLRNIIVAPVLGVLLLVTGVAPAFAASHREAPLTAADPQIDSTDLYAFVSPDAPDSVTLISNWIPFEEPAGGPNFYPWAQDVRYDINIDNNGDARPDLIYRWVFTSHYRNKGTFLMNTGPVKTLRDETLNFYQTYDLTLVNVRNGRSTTLVNDGIAAPSHVGAASMPDYASLRREAITSFGSAGKSFVGQGDDPFFLDLRVFLESHLRALGVSRVERAGSGRELTWEWARARRGRPARAPPPRARGRAARRRPRRTPPRGGRASAAPAPSSRRAR